MSRSPKIIPRAIGLVALLFLAGCYTVPETGRISLVLVPRGEEAAMGVEQFRGIKKSEPVSTDPIANERVQRVGRRIANAVGDTLPDAQWEFVVFESKDANAFALPGGKVGVYTGLLKLAESDDELAIVMGHEIGHVIARHGGERLSQGILLAAGGVLLNEALRDNSKRGVWLAAYGAGATLGVILPYSRFDESEADEIGLIIARHGGERLSQGILLAAGGVLLNEALRDNSKRGVWLAAYGAGATLGVILPYSRFDESEADEIGLKLAARAGFDPQAAITFWVRMTATKGDDPRLPTILSTHPADETRIQRLKELMPKVMPVYEQAGEDF
ncbi:MAG: hypothetical protein A3G75_16240 [Verrucomicrobia bacterium RIFCSPLOWO2_12_FULL_64_8]|nr:MAG: hypothetical protein A3G75_16240 [Verrucomicrobia bacterium RIFCSPLOWO2_12_FULL_64_8]